MSAPSAAAATPSFADLPAPALACILEQLPLQQHLSRCALVCRAWAAASASVPAHVDVQLLVDDKCRQLSAWLKARGEQVVSLTATGMYGLSLQLPCHKLSRLRSLHVTSLDCHLMLRQRGAVTRARSRAAAAESSTDSSAAGAANEAVLLPHLQELRLIHTRLSKCELLQLSALSRLSVLHLYELGVYKGNTEQSATSAQQAAAVTSLLRRLSGLSDLSVQRCGDLTTAQLMGPVSAMQRLQRLRMPLDSSSKGHLLAALPVSLTALTVSGTFRPSIRAAAELGRLTNLQHLSTTCDCAVRRPGWADVAARPAPAVSAQR